MAISPLDVKKLRDKTGAGFGDCKEALEKAGGNFEAAEKFLKEKGLASVAKRAGRAANEGRIFTFVAADKAGILEISCETDFVARNDEFVKSGKALLEELVNSGAQAPGEAQELKVKELAARIKENLSIKNYRLLSAGSGELIVDYVHGEGRVGVLTKVKASEAGKASDPKIKEFAFDCALHAAAFAPAYLNRTQVSADYLKEQEGIFKAQTENEGKSADKIPKIVEGKLNKHFAQICFVDQPFVKNDKLTVSKAADEAGKAVGTKLELIDFVYYRIGQEV